MAKDATLTIRIDENLKKRATEKVGTLGGTLSAVITQLLSDWCGSEHENKVNNELVSVFRAIKIPRKPPTYARSRSAQINFQVDTEIKEDVRRLAEQKGSTFSSVARQLLYAWLKGVRTNSEISKLAIRPRSYGQKAKSRAAVIISLGVATTYRES